MGIRSLLRVDTVARSSLDRALPPTTNNPTLPLKAFRGEPAISRLDRNFTTNHKSSKSLATLPGSALHCVLPQLQPAHG